MFIEEAEFFKLMCQLRCISLHHNSLFYMFSTCQTTLKCQNNLEGGGFSIYSGALHQKSRKGPMIM